MPDQKKPMDAGETSKQTQKNKPQSSDRVGGDAERTKATKPLDKTGKQQRGRAENTNVKGGKH
ncbi:MAG: hypothetical protein LKM36_08210 [Flavobacteriales bacterium]|jgi:hypothetical protein|nr:hypothetical protein [Flavobacteriales bacterium]